MDELLVGLRAIAESTRVRILFVLSHGEFNVSELTQILGQSQPRVSRHLKLMVEAGMVCLGPGAELGKPYLRRGQCVPIAIQSQDPQVRARLEHGRRMAGAAKGGVHDGPGGHGAEELHHEIHQHRSVDERTVFG